MKAKLIPIILGICALLTNCTVEKRVFQKGYHIEWKKKAPSGKISNELTDLQNLSDDHPQKQEQEELLAAEEQTEINTPTPKKAGPRTSSFYTVIKPANQAAVPTPAIKLSEPVSEPQSVKQVSISQKDKDTPTQSIPRTFEPVGIASFVFYFLALGLGLFAITAVNPGAVLGFTAVLLLLALILGIVSVVRFRRNRDLYQRNFFGYFGLFASAGTLVLGIFLLIIAALILLSGWPE